MRSSARTLLALLVLMGSSSSLFAQASDEMGCIVCHGSEGKQFKSSVHVQAKLTCVDCHGGDPAPMDKEAAHGDGLVTAGEAMSGVELCASCHSDAGSMRGTGLRTDQHSLYLTSQHGLLLESDESAPVATCVSCHGSHAIHRTTDPRSPAQKFNQPETCGECHSDASVMEPFGLDSHGVAEYSASAHGRALLESSHLSSPTCTDCHGSHGAAPPGYETVGRVCGDCHSVVLDYFEDSPHMAPASSGQIEECTSCHGYHNIEQLDASMLIGGAASRCAECHSDPDDPALAVGESLHAALVDFDGRIEDAEEKIRTAGLRGFFMDREHGYLDEARSLRARARSMTHSLAPDQLHELLVRGEGMIGQTYDSLSVKARTFRDRKIFTSIFLAVILLLVGVLQTYRREIFGSLLRVNLGTRRRRRDG